MPDLDRTKIQEAGFQRPHVVILGAGASLQAFPDGDANCRKMPLMRYIVDVVGLGPILDDAGIHENRDDFEKLYSHLVSSGNHDDLVHQIEQMVFNYFAEMKLPEEPTLYDHLVLSLRSKDVIATFNWDPFLVQAMVRNGDRKHLPVNLFLHGNTAIGHCTRHKPIAVGLRDRHCHRCRKPFQDSRLLYPVEQKNYNSDPFIAKNWEVLQLVLKDAFLVTFFGYSAPDSDVEAKALMKIAWGEPYTRRMEQIEIINIADESQLYETWRPFIHEGHFQVTKSFFDSIIGRSPRRSCEAMWNSFADIEYIDMNAIPKNAGWDEVLRFYDELIEDERNAATEPD
ncbi:MAG: hypothetical protein ACKVT0_13615 [Planctomycetaceae bacterium]